MIFLNALLVAGTAAAAIPLIIHLLNRTRFKVLDWGAMHLLESALKINSRRIQWQAWLLLALRMAIPAILALMLARPVLTAWRTAAGGSGHSVVLIIDNSLSMDALADRVVDSSNRDDTSRAVSGAERSSNRSCFETAIAEAATLVDKFGGSTEWTILTCGGGVTDQTGGPSFDKQRVLRKLREIRAGAGSSQIAQAFTTGLQQLAKARQPRRHMILISDFQRSEFENVTPDSLATLRDSIRNPNEPPIEIAWIPVTPASPENLSVQIDRPNGPSIVAHHQPLEVRAAIRNHGRQRVKDLQVVLSADGVSLASKSVEVAGDSQVFLVFTCQLQTLGSHVLSVSIDEPTARAAMQAAGSGTAATNGSAANARKVPGLVTVDDVARWSVEVIEPVRVGIVSARPQSSKSIDDATFLNLALSPYAVSLVGAAMSEETAGWAEAHAGADPIQCEIVLPQEITEAWLAGRDCVAMTNVPMLDDKVAQLLTAFVDRGGVLVIWAGDALQTQWYNKMWGASSSNRLLPLDYGTVSKPADRPQKSLKIQSQSYDHPALLFFNRSSNGRLDSIDFNSWYQLVRKETPASDAATGNRATDSSGTKSDPAIMVLMNLENGDPLLAERIVGRGRVYQWASSCGERWSNLPLREVFVPLVQQLVIYGATASTPPLNINTGSPLAITLTTNNQASGNATPKSGKVKSAQSPNSSDPSGAPESLVELLAPDKTRYRLELQSRGDQRSVQFARTNYPGAYQLSGVRTQPLSIVASPPADESVLIPISESSRNTLAERMEAEVHASADALWQAEVVKQTGREIWRPLLAVLVIFLLAELLLQQSLTRAPA